MSQLLPMSLWDFPVGDFTVFMFHCRNIWQSKYHKYTRNPLNNHKYHEYIYIYMNISYIKIYLSNPKSIIINIQGNKSHKSHKSNILTHLGQPDTCRSDLQCARNSAALAKSSAQAAQLKSPRFSTACQTWGVY